MCAASTGCGRESSVSMRTAAGSLPAAEGSSAGAASACCCCELLAVPSTAAGSLQARDSVLLDEMAAHPPASQRWRLGTNSCWYESCGPGANGARKG